MRKNYLDWLRILAAYAVVMIHTMGDEALEEHFLMDSFLFGVVRWAVPVFIMISGTLFLNRDISIKKIYGKYILRMAIAYVAWNYISNLVIRGTISKTWEDTVCTYQLWYLVVIIGLYMCIPIYKVIISNEKVMEYYLVLSVISTFLVPTLSKVNNDLVSEGSVSAIVALLLGKIGSFDLKMVTGYSMYFILGYYLDKKEMTAKMRYIIYALGGVGLALTTILSYLASSKEQTIVEGFATYFSFNMLLIAAAIFVWGKYNLDRNNRIVIALSKYTFGVYLVHVMLLKLADNRFGIWEMVKNMPLLSFVIALCVFLITMGISAILNRIPVVNRYLV